MRTTVLARKLQAVGPPDEIESHPVELRVELRYKAGRWLLFRANAHALADEK